MSLGLDPIVAKKLKHFGRRRFRLIVARGLCAGLLAFIIGMTLVAVADWYWLLSDQSRWLLSGAAYLGAIGAVWATSLRRLLHRPAITEIAAHVELGEPELRERLLSAVELATDDPSSLHDSPMFRGMLQGQVAQQMTQVQVPKLLPLRLVAGWVIAATILLAIVGILLTSGHSRFRQLATRAVLPGANIARVSRIHVEVLEPTPHSLTLAEDETVAIVVEVTGGEVDDVILETSIAGREPIQQLMRGRTDKEFAANLHLKDEAVEYRIMAGDAVTQRYRIESRARPHVTAFEKTFRYPEYAQLSDATVIELTGDLVVLEGTTTQLKLDLDQAVSTAELRIKYEDFDEVTVIPLQESKGDRTNRWQAEVPVDQHGIYSVHLVSKETGFENVFSPKYAIDPQPDLIPRVGFVDQQQTTMVLPPNDILALKGMAEDDLPLVSLTQAISVNGREWESAPLTTMAADSTDGRQLTAAWQWDLVTHELKTGDQLLTKLVATDRMGNTGESIPLRIIVAAPEFDPDRHRVMQTKIDLYDQVDGFRTLLEEQKTTAHEVIDRMLTGDRSEEEAALDRTTLLDLASKQSEHAGALLYEINRVTKEMPPGSDALDLDLTGRVISRIERERANAPRFLLAMQSLAAEEKQAKHDLEELKQSFSRAAEDAKQVAEHYQYFAVHNLLAAIAFDFAALLEQQKLVVNSPTQSWERLLRQETLVVEQMQLLEEVIRNQRSRVPRHIDDQFRNLLNWLDSQRLRLKDAMESEDKLAELQKVSQDFLKQLEGQQRADVMDGGLPGRLVNGRKDLQNRAGSLYVPIDEIARSTQQENRLTAEASESKDTEAGKELLTKAARFAAEVDLRHQPRLQQLRDRRELTQSRQDADAQYAADAGLTHRAVTSQLGQHREGAPQDSPIPDHLLEIAPAYRTLEAGHELMIARQNLDVLMNMERWGSQDLQSRFEQPRQWDSVQTAFETASNAMRDARVPNELVDRLNQLRWSQPVRDAGRKITERRWRREAMVSASHELVEIRNQLAEVVLELQPIMAEARAIISKYAPTIPQMAEQAAESLRELEQETTDAADTIEQPNEPQSNEQLANLERKQEAVNQQIEDLFETLVEDANRQDLLDEEQRERARDADDAIAMIQEPAAKMNRALEEAQQVKNAAEQAQELAQAAEQQERTAQALEKVAEHFERLNEGLDVADSRAELRQMEREQGLARQMDQQFNDAEQLAAMANQDALQLLQELEAELQQNPAMQQALSEISRNALQDAKNALDYAAQDEENIQRANERSDEQFQAKKREIAEDLREMARDASNLSNLLVNQARDAAARGQTAEAQKKFEETREKLNEAAAKANTANDSLLLADLAKAAQETKDAIREATESLKQAEQQTSQGKDEKIHEDDKRREAAKKDAENRRKQFHEQQKRAARDDVKRAEDVKRRADQNVNNAENQLRNVDRNLQQAKNNLNRKPDDEGLKRNVAQQEQQKVEQQARVEAAKKEQQEAQQNVDQQKREAEQIERKAMPPLNAQNPETELADQYAEEAIKVAEELNRQAEQLANSTNFNQELRPTRSQLAASQEQQGDVREDVQNAAEDIARAARHERRLNNQPVVQPLEQVAQSVAQVAENQAQHAEQKLESATGEAQQADEAGQQAQARPNGAAMQAQQAVEQSENAIAQQAEQLTGVLEPLLAAAEAANNAAGPPEGQQNGTPQQGQPMPGQPQAGQPQTGQGDPAAQANSQSVANGETPPTNNSSTNQPTFTPEELERGQQLARTLDELDRQQIAAATQAQNVAQQDGMPQRPQLDSLSQAAQAQQAALASARVQAQQQAIAALHEGEAESTGVPADTGPMTEFTVGAVDRTTKGDWGKLRGKSAEDLTRGRGDIISEEYRKSVEAYFKVLAERSRKK